MQDAGVLADFFLKCLLILIDDNLKVLAKSKYMKG